MVKDKTVLARMILFLAEQNPEAIESLSPERRAKINELRQFNLDNAITGTCVIRDLLSIRKTNGSIRS